MKFSQEVFRAYDIRGLTVGNEAPINFNFAHALGYVFAQQFPKKQPKIILARDNRLSGRELIEGLRLGLAEGNCQIFDLGEATSPYFYFTACAHKCDGGIQITASHNPREFNGFKIIEAEARPFFGAKLQNLSQLMQAAPSPQPQITQITKIDLREAYFQKLCAVGFNLAIETRQKFKLCKQDQKPLKIVIDCGHGVAGYFAPDFFRRVGAEVVELFCQPDGNFPLGVPDPEHYPNLERLSQKVRATKADLGIAFDGDGDRLGAVDAQGQIISADKILILLARELLKRKPKAEIICDIKASGVLVSEVERAGGRVQRHKTGHSFIKERMRELQAPLAGEISGHFFFGENYFGFDDALLAAFKLAKIIVQAETDFGQTLAELPQIFATPDYKITVEDSQKFKLIEEIAKICEQQFSAEQISRLDGIRIEFAKRRWILIRASNTSPKLTLRFEAESESALRNLQQDFRKILNQVGIAF